MATITLVSARVGDRVGDTVELAELGDPEWARRPGVLEFFAANQYGYDADPEELMYVLAEDEPAADFYSLAVEVSESELAEVRAALADRAAQLLERDGL